MMDKALVGLPSGRLDTQCRVWAFSNLRHGLGGDRIGALECSALSVRLDWLADPG